MDRRVVAGKTLFKADDASALASPDFPACMVLVLALADQQLVL
jgi:hypothetical protein